MSHPPNSSMPENKKNHPILIAHGGGETTTTTITTFPGKLFKLLQEADVEGFQDVVSWQEPGGKSFKVHKPNKFSKEILPKYFKQSKYKSFQRQLNIYGFQRIHHGIYRGGYTHTFLNKDTPDSISLIKREQVYDDKRRCSNNKKPTTTTTTKVGEVEGEVVTLTPLSNISNQTGPQRNAIPEKRNDLFPEYKDSDFDPIPLDSKLCPRRVPSQSSCLDDMNNNKSNQNNTSVRLPQEPPCLVNAKYDYQRHHSSYYDGGECPAPPFPCYSSSSTATNSRSNTPPPPKVIVDDHFVCSSSNTVPSLYNNDHHYIRKTSSTDTATSSSIHHSTYYPNNSHDDCHPHYPYHFVSGHHHHHPPCGPKYIMSTTTRGHPSFSAPPPPPPPPRAHLPARTITGDDYYYIQKQDHHNHQHVVMIKADESVASNSTSSHNKKSNHYNEYGYHQESPCSTVVEPELLDSPSFPAPSSVQAIPTLHLEPTSSSSSSFSFSSSRGMITKMVPPPLPEDLFDLISNDENDDDVVQERFDDFPEEEENGSSGDDGDGDGDNDDNDDSDLKKTESTFPSKLFRMLEDAYKHGFDHIVSWTKGGKGFKVHDMDSFVTHIMPNYFDQTKYESFRRQLNLYGFDRVVRGIHQGVYYHKNFVRHDPSQCRLVTRPKTLARRSKNRRRRQCLTSIISKKE